MLAHPVLAGGNLGSQSFEIETGEGVLPGDHIGIAETVQGLLQPRGGEGFVYFFFILTAAFFLHFSHFQRIVRQPFQQQNVQFAGTVHPDGQDPLDVGGTAGPGDVGEIVARLVAMQLT